MKYDFIDVQIPCGYSAKQTEFGYKLSNGVLLMPSERDINGYYFGAVGLDGIFLRTGTRYQPIYDDCKQLQAFQKVV
jgi:hypothetical protein